MKEAITTSLTVLVILSGEDLRVPPRQVRTSPGRHVFAFIGFGTEKETRK